MRERIFMLESLVLNAAGIPVSIVSWQRAISLYFAEKAIILSEYENGLIHSPSMEMKAPAVVQCIQTHYMPRKFVRVLPFSRKNVFLRDKGECCYCNKQVTLANFTFDHVVPKCMGGRSEWANVVVSCMRCNSKKGGKTPERAGMKLIRKPFAPRLDKAAPANLVSRTVSKIPHESWEDYIYWNIILDG
ncbi:MAG: HNH endonuclease [Chitinivibrionales bacterium]|nr:HNH endonuclease [Chitinivibrionales bacterium]